MKRRVACDRCHALKERCVFRSNSPTACSRCARLNTQCTTLRQKNSVGRPRRTETVSTEPQIGAEFVWLSCPLKEPEKDSRETWRQQRIKQTSTQEQQPPPTCTAVMMRKPTSPLLLAAGSTPLTQREILLLHDYLTNRRLVVRFLLSASFADGLLSHLSVTLHEAPDIFLHAALACSERFARLLFHHPLIEGDERGKDAPSAAVAVGQTGECYNHSAKAVVALRGMESGVLDRGFGNRQVVFALTLGLGLVTFDLMDSGQGAHEICRFTLGLVERGYNKCSGGGDKGEGWVYRTGRVPEVDPGMVPLVFMDLVNCVVKGQIPVCRLEVGIEARGRVDQYIGVCGELLAPLFDLCRLSHELSHELSTLRCWRKSPLDGSSAILEELEYIEDTISEWQPQPSHNFGRALTSEEIYMVNTQARVFRDTVLLLTHRLRYGFGKHNDATRTLTDAIFTGIDTLTRGTVPSTSQDDDNPRFDYRMTFPFFVAAIGMQHPAERTTAREKLSRVVCGTLYPKVSEQLGQALTSVWDAQDSGNCTRWSDLVSPAVLPPVLF